MKSGLVERRGFEYIRHGTQCLTVNFQVATGQIIALPYAQAHLLVESSRNLVQHLGPQAVETGQFYFSRRLA